MGKKSEIDLLAEELKLYSYKATICYIENGALNKVLDYLPSKSLKKVVLIYDENTYHAAGKFLLDKLQMKELETKGIMLKSDANNQVLANEESIVQVLLETPNDTEILLAVGSGTIHDIVRFVSYKMNIPFLSVPTAASVDGFTSKGAPLIIRGFKQTIQTAAPLAVFADIDVLKNAPLELTAAGFGDILGKYTSLLDWEISRLIGNEPYNQTAAKMMRRALESCVNHVEEISNRNELGISILMNALIESGLVMQLLDHSRPASGAEHHLSHYWEMYLLKNQQVQLLHGAKVAVATTIISELYKKDSAEILTAIKKLQTPNQKEHGGIIKDLIDHLPDIEVIRHLIRKVGGPSTIDELGIPNDVVQESLANAHHLRDRCTGLRLINEGR